MAEGKTRNLVSNKRARSFFFMLISFGIILALNSVLPLIEGEAHYTVETVEVTYAEYVDMKEENVNYSLTYLTKIQMKLFIDTYVENHPELTEEEIVEVDVPDNFKVKVHTKFFFEYPFWYISTATSLLSAILLFYSLFNYLVTVGKDRYEQYVKLKKELNTMSDTKLDPVTFEPWMDNVFNYNRKVSQHTGNVKFLIDKLERKTNYKHKKRLKPYYAATNDEDRNKALSVFKKFDKKEDRKIYKHLKPLTRKEKKYMSKKDRLVGLLDELYIVTYVTNGRVKYFKYIHPMFVYNGTNSTGRTVDSYSLISSDGEKIISDAGAKIVFSLSITLIFSTLFTVTAISSIGQSPLWIFINIMAKLAPLFIQIPLAFDYYNSFMEKHLIKNLLERRAIGLRYMADMRNNVSIAPILPPDPVVPKKEVETDARENIGRNGSENPTRLGDGTQEQGHS